MAWFGIRTVFYFGAKASNLNVFEERVVCFEAADFEAAHKKAKAEAEQYALVNGFELYPTQVAYEQDGENLIDGYEVWSELFESPMPLNEFWAMRYKNYEYKPE